MLSKTLTTEYIEHTEQEIRAWTLAQLETTLYVKFKPATIQQSQNTRMNKEVHGGDHAINEPAG